MHARRKQKYLKHTVLERLWWGLIENRHILYISEYRFFMSTYMPYDNYVTGQHVDPPLVSVAVQKPNNSLRWIVI